MSEGALCEACLTGTLYLQDGLLVCDACNITVQSFIEETQEYQAGISDAAFFRRSQLQSSQKAPTVVQELRRTSVADALTAYVGALQELLKKQINALVEKLKASKSIKNAAKEIWFSYLAAIKILEPACATALDTKVKSRQEFRNPMLRKPFEFFNITKLVVEPEVHHILPPSTSLLVLFLASWYTRQALDPLDICQLALDGHIPYLSFYTEHKEQLSPCHGVLGESFLAPAGVPPPSFLCTRSIEIAQRIGLKCPPINAVLWMQRYVRELDLPNEVFAVASHVYNVYGEDASSVLSCTMHPWAHVMSIVVMAMRLICDMDGRKAVVRKPHIEGKWVEWAKQLMARAPAMSFYPLSTQDALQLDLSGLQQYLEYLHETFLLGRTVPSGMEELSRSLLQFARSSNESVPMEADAAVDQLCLLTVVDTVDEDVLIEHADKAYGGSRSTFSCLGVDYAAVITVASLRCWIAPSSLVETVRILEERMIDAECQVAFAYDEEAKKQAVKKFLLEERDGQITRAPLDAV